MRELLPPEKMPGSIDQAFPWIWKEADAVRGMRGAEMPDWDRHVFLPVHGWGKIFSEAARKRNLQMRDIAMVEITSPLGAWRPAQDIVHFDNQLYVSLLNTPFNGSLPSEIRWRLPAKSVYIETPELNAMGGIFDGFGATLNIAADRRELRPMFVNNNDESLVEFLSLEDWGLEKLLVMDQPGIITRRAEPFTPPIPAKPREMYPALASAISLLPNICAYGFMDNKRIALSNHPYHSAKRAKKGWRLFPPDKSVIHAVGKEIGENLRNIRHAASGVRKSSRPHLRRARRHGFWSGPRKEPEKRKFDLIWLPPMPVTMKEEAACRL